MQEYMQYMCLRGDPIDGNSPWMWVAADTEAWTGIRDDWNKSHKKTYEELVEEKTVCVQAGGCMGMQPRLLSDMFKRVYTFEPDPLNFLCLAFNCQKDNIIKLQAALGHENKLITVNRKFQSNLGMNTINEDHQIIPMITLDSLNLDACSFIQLDVEYYELNVLRGAVKTIEKFKPVISCELGFLNWFNQQKQAGLNHNGKLLKDNTLNADILEFLEPFGYKKIAMSCADAIYKVV